MSLDGLHDGEKMAYLFQTIFVLSTSEAFKRSNIKHGHYDKCTKRECKHFINSVSNDFIMWGVLNAIDLIFVEHVSI